MKRCKRIRNICIKFPLSYLGFQNQGIKKVVGGALQLHGALWNSQNMFFGEKFSQFLKNSGYSPPDQEVPRVHEIGIIARSPVPFLDQRSRVKYPDAGRLICTEVMILSLGLPWIRNNPLFSFFILNQKRNVRHVFLHWAPVLKILSSEKNLLN